MRLASFDAGSSDPFLQANLRWNFRRSKLVVWSPNLGKIYESVRFHAERLVPELLKNLQAVSRPAFEYKALPAENDGSRRCVH